MNKAITPSAKTLCTILIWLLAATEHYAQISVCDSVNTELNTKFRILGEWDSEGTPLYMEAASDEVSEALINFINEELPERADVSDNPELFGLEVKLNTELVETSTVYLTHVHEGADWKNTLGFYTYDVSNPPQSVYDLDSLVILFPNVSQTDVIKPGDKILLGEFPANTGIGYFLIPQGWTGSSICLKTHIIFTDPNLNTFTEEPYRQHAILLSNEQEDKFLLGFEDIKRPGGDNDFNDAVFYITATPGAIDTTNVPKVPTAYLSGDTVLCDVNDPATLTVELTGIAPWAIVYSDGNKEIEISDITEDIFTFETTVKDTIKLVSVSDKTQPGLAEGEVIIELNEASATLTAAQPICAVNGDEVGFTVELEGTSPFSLSYMLDDELVSIDNILEDQYKIIGEVGQKVELVEFSDAFCDGDIFGTPLIIEEHAFPTLSVTGEQALCGEQGGILIDLELTGDSEKELFYTIEGEQFSKVITSESYQLEIATPGQVVFTSLKEGYCEVALDEAYSFSSAALPTANITDFVDNCSGTTPSVGIEFTGEGPWTLHYKQNGEDRTTLSENANLDLEIEYSSIIELVSVEDSNCENLAEGSATIELVESPTAEISGEATLCLDEETQINIEMTGEAPFTFVYSNGEEETEITTDDYSYTIAITEPGKYTLVSYSDANCTGIMSGSADILDGSDDINVEIDSDPSSCIEQPIELGLLGSTEGLSILWSTDGQGNLETLDQVNTVYTPAEGESGNIEFFVEVSDGCATKTVSKVVPIQGAIDASFDVSPSEDLLTNSQITFTPSNGSYDSYHWDFGDETTSSASIATTEYAEGGIYTVLLTVQYQGCQDSSSVEIEVLAKDELYIPNAFNPNAINPENQVVKVYGNNISDFDFSFKIVNRWGKTMYQTNSFSEANTIGWDGINNNTNEELELNVFTYVVSGRFIDGATFEKTGTITQVK